MSDHAALARLAAEVGLPADAVAALLAGDRFTAEVRDDERTAAGFGIGGVPFFVVDRALRRVRRAVARDPRRRSSARAGRRAPLEVVTGGDSCGVDGC